MPLPLSLLALNSLSIPLFVRVNAWRHVLGSQGWINMVPDDVIFLESLPVGGTGKVQKGDLRKTYGGVFS